MIEVDAARLSELQRELDSIGRHADGGWHRLAFDDADIAARAVVVNWARARGWPVWSDETGNLFAVDRDNDEPVVLCGSHLDTQPHGGSLDGAYGVVGAIVAMELLGETGVVRRGVVVWANEEGRRFAPTTMGSGAYTGALDAEAVRATRDDAGTSVAEAVDRMARTLALSVRPGPDAAAYVEAHIEQGPELERRGDTIGVVDGVQGLVWLQIDVVGVSAHAGTTPMDARRDALQAAAHLVVAIDGEVRALDPAIRCTIGRFEVSPGSTNTVAGAVRLTVDMRHVDGDVLDRAVAVVHEHTRSVERFGFDTRVAELARTPAAHFDARIVASVERAARTRGHRSSHLVSGATHDAHRLACVCPTGMVFVPSEGGVSHHAAERTDPDALLAGVEVLTDVLAELIAHTVVTTRSIV